MNNRDHMTAVPRGISRRLAATAAVLLWLPVAGCDLDKILTANDPDVATPGSLNSAQALPAVLAGALGDFQVAYSGSSGSEGQINYAGLFSDEFLNVESFPTRVEIDQRNVQIDNSANQGVFRDLARARASAEFAAEKYAEFDPGTVGHATALAMAGFAYILFAENYCSGVPFSRLTATGATEYGQPQTTVEMFTTAIARFDEAIALATALDDADAVLNLARVGKARAQLGLGQFAAAATTVQNVPTSFFWLVEHSTNSGREQNGIFAFVNLAERWAVANNEGGTGLPFRSDADPRVPWARATGDLGFDNFTPMFDQLKYPGRDADVILASGLEARLIEAEAALKANQFAAALTILNNLRQNPPAYSEIADPLPALVDPGTQVAREDLLFKERAYWLWLTSHRLGDLRRLIKFYGRTQQTVFPTGPYSRPNIGGEYGTDVNLPVPVDELNNPNFTGCLDRNA